MQGHYIATFFSVPLYLHNADPYTSEAVQSHELDCELCPRLSAKVRLGASAPQRVESIVYRGHLARSTARQTAGQHVRVL